MTVAGWPNGTQGAALSQLYRPVGICITDSDVLYIANSFNHRILVVHLDFTIDNFAIGSGQGASPKQFNIPNDVSIFDAPLYVVDLSNHRVQKMSLNGSNPTTVANFSELQSLTYLYVDSSGNIYATDRSGHCIWVFFSNSTAPSIVAGMLRAPGASDSQLNEPEGVFVTKEGAIYVADRYNDRIVKWLSRTSSGVRVAGDGKAGRSLTRLDQPVYVILGSDEYLYISEVGHQARIMRWRAGSTCGACIAACTGSSGVEPTQLHHPHSFAFDREGSLYVSDWNNHRVQKFQRLSPPGEY